MVDKQIGKFNFIFDFDIKNWGFGFWLHLDGLNTYKWAFEFIIGCIWFEILYREEK